MALPIIGTGIPWYRREDYTRALEIMVDGDSFPATYDQWQQRAEQVVSMVEQKGGVCIRVPLDPEKFRAWCMLRGLHVNGSARMEFASDPANWPDKH